MRRIVGVLIVISQLLFASRVWSEEIEALKAGIVKISSQVDGKTKVGTGFIVRLEKDAAYIITAAHVVEGDQHPRVAFYPRANEWSESEVLGIEGGDPRGVAALLVKAKNVQADLRTFAAAKPSW